MKTWKKVISGAAAASMLAMSLTAMTAGAAEFDAYNPPVATVAQGEVMGYMDEGTYTFLGIPYAKAERFEMPEEAEAWEGTFNAQAYGPVCRIPRQESVGSDEMFWPHTFWIESEDCQNLNVWTQHLDKDAKKPVIVYLHGGGHTNGSSIEGTAQSGRNLSEFGDVVVVSINHRLNALGYLDLSAYGEEYKYTANLGYADMVAALKWVNQNIEVFGGDPENVTIWGQSGGGRKVLTLMHMPEAEGLFNKVISMSGTAHANGVFIDPEVDQMITAYTLENLGLDESQADELRTVNYEDLIVAATQALTQTAEESGASNVRWDPQIDGDMVLEDYCDWASDIPIIVGSAFGEGQKSFEVGDGRKKDWSEEEVMALLTERYGENTDEIIKEFSELYPEKDIIDAYFYCANMRLNATETLTHKNETGEAPVYCYNFNYEAPVNGGVVAFHCADLIYAFHNVDIPVVKRATGGAPEAYTVQDTLAGAIVSYAYTGNPSQENLEWKPYTTEEPYVMQFDAQSVCRTIEDEHLCNLMLGK